MSRVIGSALAFALVVSVFASSAFAAKKSVSGKYIDKPAMRAAIATAIKTYRRTQQNPTWTIRFSGQGPSLRFTARTSPKWFSNVIRGTIKIGKSAQRRVKILSSTSIDDNRRF